MDVRSSVISHRIGLARTLLHSEGSQDDRCDSICVSVALEERGVGCTGGERGVGHGECIVETDRLELIHPQLWRVLIDICISTCGG